LHLLHISHKIESVALNSIHSISQGAVGRGSLTWKKSSPCFNPALHSLSNVLISLWRKIRFNTLAFCWASTNALILWRVLEVVNKTPNIHTWHVLREFPNVIQHAWGQVCPDIQLYVNKNNRIEQLVGLLHQ
jgi:hypothetical protein